MLTVSTLTRASIGCALVLLAGCSSGLSGTYLPRGSAFFQKIVFTSSSQAEITFYGSTKQVSYSLSGNKLTMTGNGDTQVLTVNGNCIDGGPTVGTYCKS